MKVLSSEHKNDTTPSQLVSAFDYRIIYVKSGEAVLKIGNTDFILSGNQLLLLTALEEHTVSVTNPPFQYYSFSIAREDVKLLFGSSLFSSLFFKHSKNAYHIFDFSETHADIETLVARIEKEFETANGKCSEMFGPLIKLLILEMYKANPSPFSNELRANKAMQKIQEYIELHFDEDITVEQLAKSAFLTAPYLSHSFKRYSGYSPKQYLTYIRILSAKKLLLTTNLPVNDVCRKIGFSDINNFIRTFKGFYGITPKKYREKK